MLSSMRARLTGAKKKKNRGLLDIRWSNLNFELEQVGARVDID